MISHFFFIIFGSSYVHDPKVKNSTQESPRIRTGLNNIFDSNENYKKYNSIIESYYFKTYNKRSYILSVSVCLFCLSLSLYLKML
jgi:hypothetical protein